mmetsp:Transcript_14447/g.62672  ORF Transcript_14447/g.62672 Transcript_14447/m.62672 type:complete len:436 (+) Transcript_14447:394-1701(+)
MSLLDRASSIPTPPGASPKNPPAACAAACIFRSTAAASRSEESPKTADCSLAVSRGTAPLPKKPAPGAPFGAPIAVASAHSGTSLPFTTLGAGTPWVRTPWPPPPWVHSRDEFPEILAFPPSLAPSTVSSYIESPALTVLRGTVSGLMPPGGCGSSPFIPAAAAKRSSIDTRSSRVYEYRTGPCRTFGSSDAPAPEPSGDAPNPMGAPRPPNPPPDPNPRPRPMENPLPPGRVGSFESRRLRLGMSPALPDQPPCPSSPPLPLRPSRFLSPKDPSFQPRLLCAPASRSSSRHLDPRSVDPRRTSCLENEEDPAACPAPPPLETPSPTRAELPMSAELIEAAGLSPPAGPPSGLLKSHCDPDPPLGRRESDARSELAAFAPPGASPPADMVHRRKVRRCPDEDPLARGNCLAYTVRRKRAAEALSITTDEVASPIC